MKPHKLVLENFGAYRRRAEIAFDELGPLFLVWGKTGSGKTTLFDAITYALYGAAPGSRSGLERQLWSHYAQAGEPPLVELEFSLADRLFRVLRVPPYRRRKRGGALGDAPAEAALWAFDESSGSWRLMADKITEVDAAIEKRIGLSVDEFSKIILLPQGEFQRFLEMDSTERVSVLEKLFPVEEHDAVARLAKEEAKAALAEVRRVDAELTRLAQSTGPDDAAAALASATETTVALTAERDAALNALSEAESILRAARAGAERARRAADSRRRLAALEDEAPDAAARQARIAAARAAQSALHRVELRERAEAELGSAVGEAETRRADLAALDARASEIESLRAEAARRVEGLSSLDREIGELERAVSSWNGAMEARAAIEAARSSRAACEEREALAAESEAALGAAIEKTRVGAEEEARIRSAAELAQDAVLGAEASLRAAQELDSLAGMAEKRGREAADRAKEAERAAAELDALRESFRGLEARRAQNAALRLARGLEEGTPCPVCGSTSHPAPAHGNESDVGDIDDRRADMDRALSAAASAAERGTAAAASAEAARTDLEARLASGKGLPELEEAKARALEAGLEREQTAGALRAMEERRKKTSLLAAELETARAKHAEATRLHSQAREDLASLEAGFAAAVAHAGGADPRPSLAAARDRRSAASGEADRLQKICAQWTEARGRAAALLAEAERRVPPLALRRDSALADERDAVAAAGFRDVAETRAASMANAELAALEAAAESYGKRLAAARAELAALGPEGAEDQVGDEALEAMAVAARSAREAYDSVQTRLEAAQAERGRLEALAAERSRLYAERAALDERSSAMAELSALLNGELPGRRLPFKNFVLGMYFRSVVERASVRLAQLSDARYALVADEGSAAGKGKVGLELLVRDSYTGQARSAGTLSGGERFLTALGLALGLADTIRDRSGGASLEAIFIDEGFGSLDEEALDRAISALDEVRGDRIIGIVSHVAELRSRIPSRIEVAKGRGGSHLKIVD